jgi:hypothetical protein
MAELTSEILQEQLNKLATKQDIQELASSVKTGFDAVDKRFDDVDRHLSILERKVDKAFIDGLDRHEKWIKQIADKIGIALEA